MTSIAFAVYARSVEVATNGDTPLLDMLRKRRPLTIHTSPPLEGPHQSGSRQQDGKYSHSAQISRGISPMKRRQLLQSTAAATAAVLARPALAQPGRVLRYVPQADLTNPDPVWSTATIAFIHGNLIWDQLYGLDEGLVPRPQMVGGEQIEDDGL